MKSENFEERIIELETKISYQEDLIQEFNKHVISQQNQIDQLTNLCEILKQQLKEVHANLPDSIAGDEKPPHY